MWAASTRCRVAEDIDILRGTWSSYLDPSKTAIEERPFGSKALIYACKDFKNIKVFSRRTALTEEQYNNAAARWEELGMPGEAPNLKVFDDLKD